MAECQAPFLYNQNILSNIEAQLSTQRFSTYIVKAGHHQSYAIQLYLYNARLAKSLLFPLHVFEVVLRNAIDDVISSIYGVSWHNDASFLGMLSIESNNSLQKAIRRSPLNAPKDDIVSQLTLDFWSNLFRAEYDRPLWQANMKRLLPNISVTRKFLQKLVVQINKIRNRIAHHEPILDLNVSKIHQDIVDVVSYRSQDTANWLSAHSTVDIITRTRPRGGSGPSPTVGDRCDRTYLVLSELSSVYDAKQSILTGALVLCANDTGSLIGVLDPGDISRYIFAHSIGGLIDLNEHSLREVVDFSGSDRSFIWIDENDSMTSLRHVFRKKVRFAVVFSPSAMGKAVGVIAKAHRLY